MSGSNIRRNPVEALAEEFLDGYRRGERPALTEYVRRHPELADEIRDLFPALVMMEEAGPKSAVPAAARAAPSAGACCERLGDYRILREVGRGGMGIVYEAEQESLSRHVALKVLPAQLSTNPTYLQRFRREARSAARLHHTNIVPVHDVGEFQGTHYYAMQFIQGQGLDEVLDELRRLRGVASPNHSGAVPCPARSTDPNLTAGLAHGLLTNQIAGSDGGGGAAKSCHEPEIRQDALTLAPPAPRIGKTAHQAMQAAVNAAPQGGTSTASTANVLGSRSELSSQSDYHFHRSTARVGLQVAEALGYAHAQKVLHRDIKPANLLLDMQGIIWVTDFGLAKEEGDDLTQTGDLVGTLRYMAPERFGGLSDARSDVYSLGLTLYELVTLRPAFEETDRGRLINQIAHAVGVLLVPPTAGPYLCRHGVRPGGPAHLLRCRRTGPETWARGLHGRRVVACEWQLLAAPWSAYPLLQTRCNLMAKPAGQMLPCQHGDAPCATCTRPLLLLSRAGRSKRRRPRTHRRTAGRRLLQAMGTDGACTLHARMWDTGRDSLRPIERTDARPGENGTGHNSPEFAGD
jgi:tRNA A-37 threonylcarbamoyl transferase component Bud32